MTALRSNLAAKIIAIFLAGIMGFLFIFSIVDALVITALVDEYATKEAVREKIAETFLNNSALFILEQYQYGNDILNTYEEANYYFELFDKNGNEVFSNYNDQAFWFSRAYISGGNSARFYVKNDLQPVDNMSFAVAIFDFAFDWRSWSILIIILCGVSFILLITFLLCSAGHKKGKEGITLNLIDKIPLEVYTALFVFTAIFEVKFLDTFVNDIIIIGFVCIFTVIDFLLIIGYIMSIATRIKSRTLFSNTVSWFIISAIIKVFKTIYNFIKKLFLNLPLIWKSVLLLWVISLLEIVVIIIYSRNTGTFIYYWLVEKIILIPCVLMIVLQFKNIKSAIKNISKGKLDTKIDTSNMHFDFKETAQDLNNINVGLSNAVEEKMKSERFKTELITNVSHDIKTPLTSIINYVDLIKKEPVENDDIKDYVDVLDRQSKRLKKLIEDLVEASKASSGSLSVSLKPLDLNVLLVQAVGEYQEKLEERTLQLVVSYNEEPVFVLADGRHLWRVFDNLMNNIIKYSQNDTRVYLSLEKIGDRAVVTLRNISKEKLNISSEELMERFVRGDSSRNTEGSGLGLSIAKSLTELQKGNMQLFVDGDLFKVVLTFELLDEEGILNEENESNTNA